LTNPNSAWEIARRERDEEQRNISDGDENKEEKKEDDAADAVAAAESEEKKEDSSSLSGAKKARKKRTPQENRQLVIKKLCKEAPPSLRNRVHTQYLPPIKKHSVKSLLKIMETFDAGSTDIVLRRIFERLCKYRRLRVLIFNSLFEQITLSSPRYAPSTETVANTHENRARLRRALAFMTWIMQSGNPTASQLVKYMQLPTDFDTSSSAGYVFVFQRQVSHFECVFIVCVADAEECHHFAVVCGHVEHAVQIAGNVCLALADCD